jgi:uroporphyrin-III C-methyltransferase
LRAAGIAVDVIPGITAATGAAASTGITLTHRDYAQQVSFVTAAKRDGALADVMGLAGRAKTLVVYMGVARAAALKAALLADGVAADWPVAIVENATRPAERVVITTVTSLPLAIADEMIRSPALFIVGEVVKTYARAETRGTIEAL